MVIDAEHAATSLRRRSRTTRRSTPTVVVRRLVIMVAVLLVVSFAVFSLISLIPGDPVRVLLGAQSGDPVAYAQTRHALGLDKPFIARYFGWLGGVLHGDLGRSYINGQSVVQQLRSAIPATAELALVAEFVALVVGIVVGVVCAWRQGRLIDRALSAVTSAFISIPPFVLAVLVIYLFAVTAHWLPATGYAPLGQGIGANVRFMILPVLVLSSYLGSVYARVLRTDMAETLTEGHIQLARAKGEPTWRILFVHALRPSSLNLVTAVGINLGNLVGATILIETVFGLSGVGRLLIISINQRDYLVTQGVVLLVAATYVVTNALVDVLYAVLDPRMRRS
ncbi:MAG TPA: ABC transporter permease [Pseudonocardiaceae bacterium]|nr:ABC transporter permease [Pseudonocardiaceae bacterium]